MNRVSDPHHWGWVPNFCMTLCVTVGPATISWYAMEKPLMALGRSLNRQAMR